MALLPLAASAAQLRAVEALSPYYGLVPQIVVYGEGAEPLTVASYTFDGYFSGQACTEAQKLTPAQVQAMPAGTPLWAKVTGKNGYEGSKIASFEIKKMPLLITGAFVAEKDQKVYAAAEPTGNLFTVTAIEDKVNHADFTAIFENKITFAREFESVLDPVGYYGLIATITDNELAANYTVESADILIAGDPAKFEITPKAFTTGDEGTVTISVSANLTYNGDFQKATVVVTDKVLGTLTEATYYTAAEAAAHNAALGVPVAAGGAVPADFADVTGADAEGDVLTAGEAEAYNNVLVVAEGDPKDGDYYLVWANNKNAKLKTADGAPQVTIKGMGNYQAGAVAPEKFTIKQATLIVTPSAEKVYDGHDNIPTLPTEAAVGVGENPTVKDGQVIENNNVTYTFQGFVAEEDATIITINTTDALEVHVKEAPALVWKATKTNPHVSEGNVIKFSNADINKCFTTTNDNYYFYANEGTFDITKKNITVTVGDKTLKHGDPEVYTVTPAGHIHEGTGENKVNDDDAIKDAIMVVREAAAGVGYDYDLNARFMTNAEIDATTLSAAKKTAAKNAVNDYNITAVTKGKLTLENANLTIALNESKFTLTKVYDGQDINITTDIKNKANLIIIGLQDQQETVDLTNLTLTAVPNANDNIKDAGTYQLVLAGASIEGYDITYVPSQYKITKRPIKLNIPEQSFQTTKVPTVAQNYTFETIMDGDEPLEEQGVASTDNVKDVFKLWFAQGDEFDVDINAVTGVISTAAGNSFVNNVDETTLHGIIAVDPETEGSVFDNYAFFYGGTGKFNVIAVGERVLNEKSDLTQLVASEADEDVILESDRQIKKNVWASLVLPFNTTVRQVSNALGYAVVDMFVEDLNSDAMNFKLYMGEIPAYTPFLVKTDETVNLNNVVFEDVRIVALTDANRGNLTQSNKSYNFNGNMNYDVIGEEFWSDGSKMTEDGIQFNKYAATAKCRAMKAYITAKAGVSAAPQIFIEEPDGSTTAINAITAEKVNAVKEGWYTLNGVKLNAAPVEKGIYINNGKKVVIK